jgi:hypothetical protein
MEVRNKEEMVEAFSEMSEEMRMRNTRLDSIYRVVREILTESKYIISQVLSHQQALSSSEAP